MSYRLTQFGSVTLPTAWAGGDTGTAGTALGLLELPEGAAADLWGTDPAPARYPYEAKWAAIASETTTASLRTTIDALRALRGQRAALYRKGSDSATTQWAWARLQQVTATLDPSVASRPFQRVELTFVILGPWNGTCRNTTVVTAAGSETIAASNNGNHVVRDAIVTVTAGSLAMTALNVSISGAVNWTYSSSVAATQAVVIDCGGYTVKNNGVDNYAGFALSASHLRDSWLPLSAGVNSVVVTRTGGGTGSILIDYYEQWE
jgi:hypothetical protein